MGNSHGNSTKDEGGPPLTKHGRNDVGPKLVDNIHTHMESKLSAAKRDAILLEEEQAIL